MEHGWGLPPPQIHRSGKLTSDSKGPDKVGVLWQEHGLSSGSSVSGPVGTACRFASESQRINADLSSSHAEAAHFGWNSSVVCRQAQSTFGPNRHPAD